MGYQGPAPDSHKRFMTMRCFAMPQVAFLFTLPDIYGGIWEGSWIVAQIGVESGSVSFPLCQCPSKPVCGFACRRKIIEKPRTSHGRTEITYHTYVSWADSGHIRV